MDASTTAPVLAFFAFLAACLALIGYMFASLAKQGDERRRMIVEKSASLAFLITMGSLVLRVAAHAAGLPLADDAAIGLFSTLATGALVFAIALAYHRKRYGG